MTDIEDLLDRTLRDDRRALAVPSGVPQAIHVAARRLQLRRRLAAGAAALGVVAIVFAAGSVVAGASGDGVVPSPTMSVRAPSPSPTS